MRRRLCSNSLITASSLIASASGAPAARSGRAPDSRATRDSRSGRRRPAGQVEARGAHQQLEIAARVLAQLTNVGNELVMRVRRGIALVHMHDLVAFCAPRDRQVGRHPGSDFRDDDSGLLVVPSLYVEPGSVPARPAADAPRSCSCRRPPRRSSSVTGESPPPASTRPAPGPRTTRTRCSASRRSCSARASARCSVRAT